MVTMCEFALERLSESAERQARHNLRSGDDVKTAQSNLGHAAAFTLDVYGHASEKMKQDSAWHVGFHAGRCLWKDLKWLKGQIKGQTQKEV